MRKRLETHAADLGVQSVERLEATDAAGAALLVDRRSAPSHWSESSLQSAALGCTISHLRTIKKAYEDTCAWAIVLEDDVTFEFCKSWPAKRTLADFVAQGASKGAQVLLLSWCLFSERNHTSLANARAQAQKWMKAPRYNIYGSFAYALSRSAMKSILDQRWAVESNTWNVCRRRPKTAPITADALLLEQTGLLMSTVPLVAYECLDSTVHPNHLSLHRRNLEFLRACVQQQQSTNENDDSPASIEAASASAQL